MAVNDSLSVSFLLLQTHTLYATSCSTEMLCAGRFDPFDLVLIQIESTFLLIVFVCSILILNESRTLSFRTNLWVENGKFARHRLHDGRARCKSRLQKYDSNESKKNHFILIGFTRFESFGFYSPAVMPGYNGIYVFIRMCSRRCGQTLFSVEVQRTTKRK